MSGPDLPADIVRLVIAARIVAFEFDELFAGDSMARAARDELDKASEAFADRVPWDDEPQAPKLPIDGTAGDKQPGYSGLCG